MRKLFWFLALAVLLPATPADAQIEARGGVGLPSGSVVGGELETGYGLSLGVGFEVAPLLSIYGAYNRYTFGLALPTVPGVEDQDADVVDLGYTLGAEFRPALLGAIVPWLRAGLLYDEVELKLIEENGSTTFTSDSSLGYEVGGGLAFQISPLISITPGVRYRHLSPDFDQFESENEISYWAIELGVSYNR
ncbi:MAG TPA: outer membrane beta-barrel protein [Longimicrobiaceae bacterium]|nr:outer membrane beta-barrel protein [Longimicrobiaceae bacterium]